MASRLRKRKGRGKNDGLFGESAEIALSLRRTRSMIGNAIQQTEDLAEHISESTEQLKKICGLHDLITSESTKGKSIIRIMMNRAFWDKYIYHFVFALYMCVALYIVSKRFGNVFHKCYDWICWLLSWLLFWVPGFRFVCWNYAKSYGVFVENLQNQTSANSSFENITSS